MMLYPNSGKKFNTLAELSLDNSCFPSNHVKIAPILHICVANDCLLYLILLSSSSTLSLSLLFLPSSWWASSSEWVCSAFLRWRKRLGKKWDGQPISRLIETKKPLIRLLILIENFDRQHFLRYFRKMLLIRFRFQ